jgi:hypothetical protein
VRRDWSTVEDIHAPCPGCGNIDPNRCCACSHYEVSNEHRPRFVLVAVADLFNAKLPEGHLGRVAKLILECLYPDWLQMVPTTFEGSKMITIWEKCYPKDYRSYYRFERGYCCPRDRQLRLEYLKERVETRCAASGLAVRETLSSGRVMFRWTDAQPDLLEKQASEMKLARILRNKSHHLREVADQGMRRSERVAAELGITREVMCSPHFASEWMHAYEVLWKMRSHLFIALNRTVGSGASQSPHHCNSTGHIPEIHGLPPAEEEGSFRIIPHHHLG